VSKLALYDAWVYEEQIPTVFHWARAAGLGETLFALFYGERAEDTTAIAFFDKSYLTQDLVDAVERGFERPGTKAAALAAVRGQRFAELEARYRTLTQPALLLWGREDVVTPLRYGERLVADLPRAKLVVYPRCGHFPMIEAKNASDADLVAFLAEPAP
jgi:pimeloyl-ACP methyl ester carboxylesterase